jgi:Protein of unknown function (DUF1572)
MSASFLAYAIKEFNRYKSLGDKAIAQIPDEGLFWQYNPESNSIAMIVQHLSGNMLSRWSDIFSTDGEKPWRNRDKEFESVISSREELEAAWAKGWDQLFSTLNTLTAVDLERIIHIRNEPHTVMEAIMRQLGHYPSHVGQILYVGKMFLNSGWESLSIPRNRSDEFNRKMMSEGDAGR